MTSSILQTDIIRDKALQYIDDAVAKDKPFFIELAPTAPHDQGLNKLAVPCARHDNLFSSESMPLAPNYQVPLPNILGLSDMPRGLEYSNSKWIPRLRSLAGIDEMVTSIVDKLEALDLLDNTYIIFASDNGFHLGQHSMSYEKYTPYEEDVRVPFIILGPLVPEGVQTDYQVGLHMHGHMS